MLTDKQHAKIVKELGSDVLNEIEGKDEAGLRALVVQAEFSIKTARDELHANPKYTQLKEDLKDLNSGLSAVKKRQDAYIAYCLSLLEERGQK